MDEENDTPKRVPEPLKNVIRKSVGLPPLPLTPDGLTIEPQEEAAVVETYNMAIEVSNLKQQISDITNGLKRIDKIISSQAEDAIYVSSEVSQLTQGINNIAKKIEQLEEDKIVEFKNNDVYEVNKRIERLEAKVALINSNLVNSRIVKFFLGGL